MLERLPRVIEAIGKAASATSESAIFKTSQSRYQFADTQQQSLTRQGRGPEAVGEAANKAATEAVYQAQLLKSQEAEDIDNIYAIARKSFNDAVDAREKERIRMEATNKVLERRAETEKAVATAVEESIKRILAAGNIERQRLDVNRQIYELQKDALEKTGASFGTLWNMQQDILRIKTQELRITKQQQQEALNKVDELMKKGLGNSQEAKQYQQELQQLRLREARETAELMKAAIGQQRDFLDKALSRAFGTPGGSKWQPSISERMLFGEHTVLGGMAFRGQVDPRTQRQNALGIIGDVLNANIPGNGAPARIGAGMNPFANPARGGANPQQPGMPPILRPGMPGAGLPQNMRLPLPGMPMAPGQQEPIPVTLKAPLDFSPIVVELKSIKQILHATATQAGVPVAKLPALAGGGIVKSRTFAEIAENEAEAVIPLTQLASMLNQASSNCPMNQSKTQIFAYQAPPQDTFHEPLTGGGIFQLADQLARTTSDIYQYLQENLIKDRDALDTHHPEQMQPQFPGQFESEQSFDLSGKIDIYLHWDGADWQAMVEDSVKLLVKRGYVMAGNQWRGSTA